MIINTSQFQNEFVIWHFPLPILIKVLWQAQQRFLDILPAGSALQTVCDVRHITGFLSSRYLESFTRYHRSDDMLLKAEEWGICSTGSFSNSYRYPIIFVHWIYFLLEEETFKINRLENYGGKK